MLAASLVLFVLTLELKPSPLVPIGPGYYPRIVLGITALFAALLVAFDLFGARKPARLESANYAAVLLHFAVFGAYVVLLPGLGFRIALTPQMLNHDRNARLAGDQGARTPHRSLPGAAAPYRAGRLPGSLL